MVTLKLGFTRTKPVKDLATAIQMIQEEKNKPLSSEERKRHHSGLVFESPTILKSTKYRQRCYFDSVKLVPIGESPVYQEYNTQTSVCPLCYRTYIMPVSPERQKELDESAEKLRF